MPMPTASSESETRIGEGAGLTDVILQLDGLKKSFGPLEVLKGIDLEVRAGQRIAIIGSSGSGKSTLLRCINHMETPSAGKMTYRGQRIGRDTQGGTRYSNAELIELRANIGMVFQQFNLFPHMTAAENVMEGPLTVLKLPKAEARSRAEDYLRRVDLADKFDVYPSRLSGGQQQRVAIARALAMQPDILLFDEPTSALDPEIVGEVLHVIRQLGEEGLTMLLVTHEIGFAFHFATEVLFLHDGHILEQGPPEEVLKNPKKPRTQEFLARFTEFNF